MQSQHKNTVAEEVGDSVTVETKTDQDHVSGMTLRRLVRKSDLIKSKNL